MRDAARSALVTLVVLLGVAGCGDDGGTASGPPEGCRGSAPDGTVTVVAKDLAWDTDCLSIPADTDVTITVDNQDDGVNHNIHILGLPDGSPKTKLEAGPIQQQLELRAPAGDYKFVCDIHPNMKGDLRVS